MIIPMEVQPDDKLPPEGRLCSLNGEKVKGQKYKVTIFSTETDKADVFLAINGFSKIVKRNVETVLEECFVDILRNTLVTTVEQDPETGGKRAIKKITYPHQSIPI